VPVGGLRHLLQQSGYDAALLIDQQFMRREGHELAFVHALVRDTIYNSLLKVRRRELHRAAAIWYEPRDSALAARHLDLGEDPRAAAAYLAAAEAAAAGYRNAEALDLASRGLPLAGDPELRTTLARAFAFGRHDRLLPGPGNGAGMVCLWDRCIVCSFWFGRQG